VNATRLASKAGAMKAQNMVVLGAAASHLPLPVETLDRHLVALFKPRGERLVEANRRAFRMGQAADHFRTGLMNAGVPLGLVARVLARLSFEAEPAADAVVKAWAERLLKPDGAAFAQRVFDARDLLPLDATTPASLA
jgi:indolepyruvate ferredoxin oxidoreductase beta subunit